VVEARANETLQPVSFVGGQIGGIIDLLARNQQNLIAVVDLKFGGMDVRERELRENRPLQLAIYGHLLRCQGAKGMAGERIFPASAATAHCDDEYILPRCESCRIQISTRRASAVLDGLRAGLALASATT